MQDTVKRSNMNRFEALFLAFATIFFAVFIFLPFIILMSPKKGDIIKIDCTWSEISPDFTTEMRELCRKHRMEQLDKKPK